LIPPPVIVPPVVVVPPVEPPAVEVPQIVFLPPVTPPDVVAPEMPQLLLMPGTLAVQEQLNLIVLGTGVRMPPTQLALTPPVQTEAVGTLVETPAVQPPPEVVPPVVPPPPPVRRDRN